MPQSFTQWQSGNMPWDGGLPFVGPTPVFRDELDQMRSMWRRLPEAEYPDGYLGTINARRGDKMLQTLQRKNVRSYQRGVHKGERIDQGDYFWNTEVVTPSAGIEAQLQSKRWVPSYAEEPVILTNDGKRGPRGVPGLGQPPVPAIVDQRRAEQIGRLAPKWGI